MLLREVSFKQSYDSSADDILESFYYPVLNCAVRYDRIAGFFTSTSLAVAARGIAGLLGNKGRMRLIVSPMLSEEDAKEINAAIRSPEQYLEDYFKKDSISLESAIASNHVKALGWMIANQFLEIKIAFVYKLNKILCTEEINRSALFHQKIGIISDGIDSISFSGSINETASAWTSNVEEFKTFKSWEARESVYHNEDRRKFEEMWLGNRNNIKLMSLPEAIKQELITYSAGYKNDELSLSKYLNHKREQKTKSQLSLFDYQNEAVSMWKENDCKLLFEMATGTGKTRTAIACMVELLYITKKFITIVACPQSTLSRQWLREMSDLGVEFDKGIIADSSNPKWKTELATAVNKVNIGLNSNLVIFVTHSTCSSKYFLEFIKQECSSCKILFIGDETHGLGAYKTKRGLLQEYDYRIGLSATPSRWFDDEGSAIISEYYGDEKFEFTINDALITINPLTKKPFLVNFIYELYDVLLNEEEIDEYKKLTGKISKLSSFSEKSDEYEAYLENMIFARADILKNAESKYKALEEILDSIEEIADAIIFVTHEQLPVVMKLLKEKNIIAHRFTQNEGTTPLARFGGKSERDYLIKNFKQGTYQVLVAIKCLDEGIDIPSAKIAILMASSTNPREYIQRTGRIIRQAPDKDRAIIYDIVVRPDYKRLEDKELVAFERKIFCKEINRIEEISRNAINNAAAIIKANKIMEGTYEYKSKNP